LFPSLSDIIYPEFGCGGMYKKSIEQKYKIWNKIHISLLLLLFYPNVGHLSCTLYISISIKFQSYRGKLYHFLG